MSVELKVPASGESITEVFIGEWRKSVGEAITKGEILVELETDKVTLELPSPVSGMLAQIRAQAGERAAVGAVIALLEEGAVGDPGGTELLPNDKDATPTVTESGAAGREVHVMPAAERLLASHGLSSDAIEPTGPGHRLLKEDVQRHVEAKASVAPQAPMGAEPGHRVAAANVGAEALVSTGGPRDTNIVPMTPIRARIAERLVEAQQTAALLTTINEIDMTAAMALRSEFQDAFTKKHGVRLGFTSFFVKAAVIALREFPGVNAHIVDGEHGKQIVYHNYCDIGIAVGGGRGLVVPILRNAEQMSFAEIEKNVSDMAGRAQKNQIRLEELQGGTFTISNGGVYGSLLSTPIVNPPQSGILGLHAIQDRPVAINGEVVVRKMMYVALTYDHRIVDGREAVTFLRTIKECVENPARMLIDV